MLLRDPSPAARSLAQLDRYRRLHVREIATVAFLPCPVEHVCGSSELYSTRICISTEQKEAIEATSKPDSEPLISAPLRPVRLQRATASSNPRCLGCLVRGRLLSNGRVQLGLAVCVGLTNGGFVASVDLDECISRLYKKELLAESVIEAICAKTKELLMRESNVVHVRAPVTVVGDIHGQFYDLIEIFKIGGWCPDTNYLFLGKSKRLASEAPARLLRLMADSLFPRR